MERFAVNIKSNIFQICRLCGIDNPHKVGILEEIVSLLDGDDELPLYKKIFNCIGILVSADDKMPKTICALCFDKINDFHEFREMCYSTNIQTKKLLGLPQVVKKWDPNPLSNPIALEQLESLQTRNRKRRIDIPPDLKFNKFIKVENSSAVFLSNAINKNQYDAIMKTEIIEKKGVKKLYPPSMICNICQVNFCSLELLQSHLLKVHAPIIARYHCVQCYETIGNTLEIKNHNLWHRLSKTPFKCGRCDKKVISLQGLTRHMRECSKKIIRSVTILPNIECKVCCIEFETKNLYYMHNCVTIKLFCPKCNCKMSNPLTTFKHIASCSVKIKDEIEDNFIIKNEPIDLPTQSLSSFALNSSISSTLDVKPSLINHNPSMVVIPSDSQTISAKKSKKKNTEDAIRRCDELLKNTMRTLVSIKHEPIDDSVTNIQSNILEKANQPLNTNSNINNSNLSHVPIKEEIVDESYKDIQIKQEPIEKIQPLKLKIKKEHGTLNASFIENENHEYASIDSDNRTVNIIDKSNNENNAQLPPIDNNEDSLKAGNELETSKNEEQYRTAAFTLPAPIKIKQEIIDNSDVNYFSTSNDDFHHGDYDSDEDNATNNETDINISAGERSDEISNNIESSMLKISTVTSSENVVDSTLNKTNPDTSTITQNDLNTDSKDKETNSLNHIPQILSVKGGVDFKEMDENEIDSSEKTIDDNFVMPQITSISSGVEFSSNLENTKFDSDDDFISNFNYVQIKKEKIDPGYNDENIQYNDENNQINQEQQSTENSDIDNTKQYDMNLIAGVHIKQEIEFTEEGFGDEIQSEDDNNSDYENEIDIHINNSKKLQQITNNFEIPTIKDDDNQNNIELNKMNEDIRNSDNENIEYNYLANTNIDSNDYTNSRNNYLNTINNNSPNSNTMPIISQVSSININDIYQFGALKQDNNENNSLNNNNDNKNNEIEIINSTNQPISEPSSSSSSNIFVDYPTIAEYKNINEIAENHNNENLEKLLRNEITEQIESSEIDLIPNLPEINENNILNTSDESINTTNNSNLNLDNNINKPND